MNNPYSRWFNLVHLNLIYNFNFITFIVFEYKNRGLGNLVPIFLFYDRSNMNVEFLRS